MDTDLLRVLASWSEGPSNPGDEEGGGALAVDGDCTWFYRRYPDLCWAVPGGEFNPWPRGGAVTVLGANSYPGTPEMVEDLQRWLDLPVDNHGWMISTVRPIRPVAACCPAAGRGCP